MRILCPIHGCQPVVQISPDLQDDLAKAEQMAGGIKMAYEFEGQIVDSYHLSAEFAAEHDVRGGVVPLPDEYPNWTQAVIAVCKRCFAGKG